MEIILLINSFREKLINQRYSISSIKNYCSAIQHFLKIASHKYLDPRDISQDDIEKFIFWKIEKHNISASHQTIILSSIIKFYQLLYNKEISLKHLYPKRKETKLPKFLTKYEIKKLLDGTENIKHKAIFTTIYSCGLRLSELLELKISDIKSKDSILVIRQGKGKKDRIVNLSFKLIELLREYYTGYHPKVYLFEGQHQENILKEVCSRFLKTL